MFWNSCSKKFVKYPEKRMQWCFLSIKLHDYSLHPIIGLKAATIELLPLWTLFWRCSEKKIRKFRKFPKKKLQNCPFFSSATMCSPEFSTSTKTDCQKNVSGEFSEIWKLVRERSIMKSFTIHYWNSITTQNLHVYEKITSFIFQWILRKTLKDLAQKRRE